jgi:hypothetical protein
MDGWANTSSRAVAVLAFNERRGKKWTDDGEKIEDKNDCNNKNRIKKGKK